MDRDQNTTGFTLIETLIAMAMIATIISMVYGSYAATSRSLQRYDGQLRCAGRADLVLRLMARQIRGAYASPTDANTPASVQTGLPRLGKTRTKAPSPIFEGDTHNPRGPFLRFVTTAGFGAGLDAPRGLTRIGYRYDRTKGTLAVNHLPFVDTLADLESTARWQPLLENVTDLEVEFHDGRDWRPKWTSRKSVLPGAVRLRLVARDDNDRPYRLGTTVPVISRTSSRPPVTSPQPGRMRKP